jgi:ubiquinone/menaquinone biosynthesis C-methylase UbiE
MTAAIQPPRARKAYRGLPLEGLLARWYARITAGRLDEFRNTARELSARVPRGGRVLELAPGPGYLAIELAKLGDFRIVGLDISRSFVRMATDNAARARVAAEFQLGDAAAMPFDADSFDLIYCQAAFKNFTEPVRAIAEMHRVVKPGGTAIVRDLRKDATPAAIAAEVARMNLNRVNAFITKWVFKHSLLKRAYTEERFRAMVGQTPFRTCEVRLGPIGLDVAMVK